MTVTPAHKLLVRHEGVKTKPYLDTVGVLTIGVGRNLVNNGISLAEAMVMLDNDITVVSARLSAIIPTFSALSEIRQAVLIDMAFMGPEKIKEFTGMLAALAIGDFKKAADEMLDSQWAKQVGARARELAVILVNDRIDFE